MTDTREAVDAARKAAHDAVNHILPDDAAQYIGADFLADAAMAAYEAALEKTHVLVPREPTEAMVRAAGEVTIYGGGDIHGNGWVTPTAAPDVYRAMIAASGKE
jgi:hypothetical protein